MYPACINDRAKLALVCSFGHVQYKTIVFPSGRFFAHWPISLGLTREAPGILVSALFQSQSDLTSKTATSSLASRDSRTSTDILGTSSANAMTALTMMLIKTRTAPAG
jgi:hypothetical protein